MKHIYRFVPILVQPLIFVPVLLFFKIFCHFKVSGVEHVKNKKGRLLIAANHQSEWDPILIRAALPLFTPLTPLYYVAAPKENFRSYGWKYFIYGGFFFEINGAYSIHPGHHDYAYSLKDHVHILQLERTLCIFPEGKRVAPEGPHQAHGGVAYLSYTTDTEVVPVYIEGDYKIGWRDFMTRRRNVAVSFGKALSPKEIVSSENPSVEDFKRGGEVVMKRVFDLV